MASSGGDGASSANGLCRHVRKSLESRLPVGEAAVAVVGGGDDPFLAGRWLVRCRSEKKSSAALAAMINLTIGIGGRWGVSDGGKISSHRLWLVE